MRVIVTRPRAQAVAWVERLLALGVDAAALPLLAIAPAADPHAVAQARRRLAEYGLVVFVSPNAVEQFVEAGTPWPAGTLAGAPGPGTAEALRASGVPPEAIVQPAAEAASFDSEALWQQLLRRGMPRPGRRALIVRGEQGRDWLAQALRDAGVRVDFVAAYRRTEPPLEPTEQALLSMACSEPWCCLWHFSSSEAVHSLQRLRPRQDWSGSQALASHPRIAQAARGAGFGRVELVGVRPEDVAERLHSGSMQGPSKGPPIESRPP